MGLFGAHWMAPWDEFSGDSDPAVSAHLPIHSQIASSMSHPLASMLELVETLPIYQAPRDLPSFRSCGCN